MNTALCTVFMGACFFHLLPDYFYAFFLLIMFSAAVSMSMAVMLPALMVMAAHGIGVINQAAA